MQYRIVSQDASGRLQGERCWAIANVHAGDGSDDVFARSLAELLGRSGFHGVLQLVEGGELEKALATLPAEPTLVLVAGGDGTVRTAAKALAHTPHTLAVLPLGTINLFARTLGIPLELREAVKALAQGVDREVDLAEVNGEVFVGNCSFGIYAELVRRRALRRGRGKRSKLLRWAVDLPVALAGVLSSWRSLRVRLEGEDRDRRVPLVLVSNNEYREGPPFTRLDRHCLAVYMPDSVGRLAFAGLVVRTLLFGPRRVEELHVDHTHEVRIATRRRRLLLAMDGEIRRMSSPLCFRSLPDALHVRVPRPA
jgi:diacylglycerol kinase family enzyme